MQPAADIAAQPAAAAADGLAAQPSTPPSHFDGNDTRRLGQVSQEGGRQLAADVGRDFVPEEDRRQSGSGRNFASQEVRRQHYDGLDFGSEGGHRQPGGDHSFAQEGDLRPKGVGRSFDSPRGRDSRGSHADAEDPTAQLDLFEQARQIVLAHQQGRSVLNLRGAQAFALLPPLEQAATATKRHRSPSMQERIVRKRLSSSSSRSCRKRARSTVGQRRRRDVSEEQGALDRKPTKKARFASLSPKRGMRRDLAFLLEDCRVSTVSIRSLEAEGLVTPADFAGLSTSERRVESMLKSTLGIRSGIREAVELSRIMEAWRTARKDVNAYAEARATTRAYGESLEMKTSDFTSLVESLEMARGLQEIATDQDEDYRIPDEELPARCVLESILEQLETGNVEAHTWSEIVSLREEDRERRKGKAEPCFDIRTNGTFSKRSRRVLGRMPMDKDELREKFAIWGNAWDLLKIQGPSRRAVQGFSVSHLDAHLKWLFSERVLRRTITVGTKKTAPPTWDFFLEFEHRLRKEAARAMARKKIPLVDALALVRADESLYNRHFSSGLSLITKFLDIKDAPTDSNGQR